MEKIFIGKENATYQQLLALKENRNKRCQLGLFFVEGVQNIKEAIKNYWEIDAFIYSNESVLSNWAKSVINKANKNYILDSKLMKNLSDKEETSELLAIIKIKKYDEIIKTKCPVYVLIDRPSNKGNLGTIIRSCDALNVDQIFYSGHAVDIFDHNVISASMGSFFKMPITFIDSNLKYEQIIKSLKQTYENFKVFGTSLNANKSIQECDFTHPSMILIGNETSGLCNFYLNVADELVKIKMKENVDSLNIACATTACLYEVSRQRENK